jgi:hypothetical protein
MGNFKNTFTFELFARPSLIEGLARIMDFGHTLNTYNYSHSGEEADIKALRKDWQAVGIDLESALKEYESKR